MTPDIALTTVDFPWATCPIVPAPDAQLEKKDLQQLDRPKLIVA